MISVKNVSKEIKKNLVLNNINLDLKEGEIVFLKGHNGCGKTMLLRLICGFIKPTTGNVIGEEKYRYGVIIENPTFFLQETAYYNLKYLAEINNIITNAEIDYYLKKLNLYKVRNKKVNTFSLGMKQRLALCQAFMENPDVLLLDEPFNAIDDENLEIVYELIEKFKNDKKIIVVASHGDVSNLKFNKIVKMSNGQIVAS